MATRIEVFNSALNWAGTSILARENETTAQGNACRAIFNQQFEMALSEVPWNFAYRNSALVAVEESDVPPYCQTHLSLIHISEPTRPY